MRRLRDLRAGEARGGGRLSASPACSAPPFPSKHCASEQVLLRGDGGLQGAVCDESTVPAQQARTAAITLRPVPASPICWRRLRQGRGSVRMAGEAAPWSSGGVGRRLGAPNWACKRADGSWGADAGAPRPRGGPIRHGRAITARLPPLPPPLRADEEVMHVGRRIYVSNLAWRTSWQDLKDKCVRGARAAVWGLLPAITGGVGRVAGPGGRRWHSTAHMRRRACWRAARRRLRRQLARVCSPAAVLLHPSTRAFMRIALWLCSLQVPRVRQRRLLQRHQG